MGNYPPPMKSQKSVNCFKTRAPPPDAEIRNESAMPSLPHVPSWHARGLLSLLLCYRTVYFRDFS